jgi:hypothetical protein
MIYIYIYIYTQYIQVYNRNWFDTRWQQYSTHLHTNNTHNTEKGKLGSAGRAPSFRVIPWHLPYNGGKSTEKPQLGQHNTRTMSSRCHRTRQQRKQFITGK